MSRPSFDTLATAALAACTATTFSNPAEVAKTRLQLQGELVKKGTYQPVYLGPTDVLRKAWRSEGIQGIQRGLTGALAYSALLQTCILALYEPFRGALNVLAGKTPSDRYLASTIGGGTCTGIVGAFLGNPLFLIKARMQAYSPAFPVGAQRYYKSAWDALRSIYISDGFTGLFRGSSAAMFRTSLGTSVQMPTYFFAKSRLVEYGILRAEAPLTVITSSAAAGGMVVG
ncbi:Mitochondrial oxaloacetate transport protein [Serendipita indica DSM 11827]|uniref:Probable oxaloacetate/sulfate carrier n=1 Tax=Serendipita indica (strain DSM 11827) TaxID=1109443 RepID=G4TMR4_SERID|nr:Mitochondrial oxaloacetate transport protein [Serendipita indica DSM 11827]CCA72605.1 probable oxaloacetate/sulfate carrier [Serendipita indica DSM 11827]